MMPMFMRTPSWLKPVRASTDVTTGSAIGHHRGCTFRRPLFLSADERCDSGSCPVALCRRLGGIGARRAIAVAVDPDRARRGDQRAEFRFARRSGAETIPDAVHSAAVVRRWLEIGRANV